MLKRQCYIYLVAKLFPSIVFVFIGLMPLLLQSCKSHISSLLCFLVLHIPLWSPLHSARCQCRSLCTRKRKGERIETDHSGFSWKTGCCSQTGTTKQQKHFLVVLYIYKGLQKFHARYGDMLSHVLLKMSQHHPASNHSHCYNKNSIPCISFFSFLASMKQTLKVESLQQRISFV